MNGPAKKGSQFWMQEIANNPIYTKKLNNILGLGNVVWYSPLKKDNFKEYTLNSKTLPIEIQNLQNFKRDNIKFWPTRQSQWDALGIVDDTLILVEAKAHISETNSSKYTNKAKMTMGQINNLNLISESITEVMNHYNIKNINITDWLKGNYQISNRLVFLNYLRNAGVKVKLVLLNFTNDTYKPTSKYDFEDHYKVIFKKMTGLTKLNDPDILIKYYDVR